MIIISELIQIKNNYENKNDKIVYLYIGLR